MSKNQIELKMNQKQQIKSLYNQELNDLANICSNNNYIDQYSDSDNVFNSVKTNEDQKVPFKSLLLSSQVYQYQRSTIMNLQAEIEHLNDSYKKLLTDFNYREVEIENCKRILSQKVSKQYLIQHNEQKIINYFKRKRN